MDWIGLDWIGLGWVGLDWIGLDWIGLDWIGLVYIKLTPSSWFAVLDLNVLLLFSYGKFATKFYIPASTWLLTSLFMHVGTDCSWLDEQTDLNNVVGTIMINQQL